MKMATCPAITLVVAILNWWPSSRNSLLYIQLSHTLQTLCKHIFEHPPYPYALRAAF
jgi:hypothetical protein